MRSLLNVVLGVFFQVHHELGFGFLESVYSAAMELALSDVGLRVERDVPTAVHFRGRRIATFKADVIVNSTVLLELKACRHLDPVFEAQLLNYLRATRLEVGLLLHFGTKAAVTRRVYTNDRKRFS